MDPRWESRTGVSITEIRRSVAEASRKQAVWTEVPLKQQVLSEGGESSKWDIIIVS